MLIQGILEENRVVEMGGTPILYNEIVPLASYVGIWSIYLGKIDRVLGEPISSKARHLSNFS